MIFPKKTTLFVGVVALLILIYPVMATLAVLGFRFILVHGGRLPKMKTVLTASENVVFLPEIKFASYSEPVALADVSQNLIHATIAADDRDYFKHFGFDGLSWYTNPQRAVAHLLRVRTLSTTTSKLMEQESALSLTNSFIRYSSVYTLEYRYTRDHILEMYLNLAPYGEEAWGINAASHDYFNKSPKTLSLREAVILAGIPLSPTRFNPCSDKVDEEGKLTWKKRAQNVAVMMQKDGYISNEEYESLRVDLESYEPC